MTTEPPSPSSRLPDEDETAAAAGAGSAPASGGAIQAETTPPRPRQGRLAIGLLQSIALLGIIAIAVIAGAILVDDTKVPGWIDGLAIGAGSVILTLVVLFNGQRANRARHPRRPAR